MSDDPIIRDAIRLRDRLLDCAKEFRFKGKASTHAATQELCELDAKACEDSAAMLRKLGTEVTRLRAGIGLLHYGRMREHELVQMTRNWNSTPEG